MRRSRILIAAACALCVALVPSAAHASPTQSMTFEAPRDLKDPATREQSFNDIASLGVHSMRLVLYWHDVAPDPDSRVKPSFDETSPSSYNWGAYDDVVDGIKARGWNLLDRKSTRLNSSHVEISYAVFCLKKKNKVKE